MPVSGIVQCQWISPLHPAMTDTTIQEIMQVMHPGMQVVPERRDAHIMQVMLGCQNADILPIVSASDCAADRSHHLAQETEHCDL